MPLNCSCKHSLILLRTWLQLEARASLWLELSVWLQLPTQGHGATTTAGQVALVITAMLITAGAHPVSSSGPASYFCTLPDVCHPLAAPNDYSTRWLNVGSDTLKQPWAPIFRQIRNFITAGKLFEIDSERHVAVRIWQGAKSLETHNKNRLSTLSCPFRGCRVRSSSRESSRPCPRYRRTHGPSRR